MRAIDFRTSLFLGEQDRERSERAMHFLLHALCCINYEYLRTYGAPPLYRSGVRYDNARAGKKEWQDIPKTLALRNGDCKDLACWLVAEDWRRGVRSRPFIRYKTKQYRDAQGRTHNFSLYHVLVQRPGGALEDPSRALGMGRDEWAPFEARAAGWARDGECSLDGCGADHGDDAGADHADPPLSGCVHEAARCPACGRSCACGNWCCCAGEPVCPGAGRAGAYRVGREPHDRGLMEVWATGNPVDQLPALSPASAWAYRNVPAMNPRNIEKGDGPGYLPMAITYQDVLESPPEEWA